MKNTWKDGTASVASRSGDRTDFLASLTVKDAVKFINPNALENVEYPTILAELKTLVVVARASKTGGPDRIFYKKSIKTPILSKMIGTNFIAKDIGETQTDWIAAFGITEDEAFDTMFYMDVTDDDKMPFSRVRQGGDEVDFILTCPQ